MNFYYSFMNEKDLTKPFFKFCLCLKNFCHLIKEIQYFILLVVMRGIHKVVLQQTYLKLTNTVHVSLLQASEQTAIKEVPILAEICQIIRGYIRLKLLYNLINLESEKKSNYCKVFSFYSTDNSFSKTRFI